MNTGVDEKFLLGSFQGQSFFSPQGWGKEGTALCIHLSVTPRAEGRGGSLGWPAMHAPPQVRRNVRGWLHADTWASFHFLRPVPRRAGSHPRCQALHWGSHAALLPGTPCPGLTLFLMSQVSHHSVPYLLHCHRLLRDHRPGHLPLGPPARARRRSGAGLGKVRPGPPTERRKLTPPASWVSTVSCCQPQLAAQACSPTPSSRVAHAIPGHGVPARLTRSRTQCS